jgi:protein TonB
MDQPQRFGQFLLFRQSESNSYRSCYRAGLARGRAIENIVRLEVFDRPEIDIDRLLPRLGASADLQEKLNDPHIVAGAGVGQVDGIPYTAYSFELGTTLSSFLNAAREQSFPVPFDQALFIAERIALALAAAYQVEHHDRRVLHSFLTPDSVLLTNEGQVKVSGFEVGHALREQLAGRPFCAPYLSPKCRDGRDPIDQDDVFSLGAILFELVTGEPLPTEPVDLDGLIVQATGEPVPESLRLLLEGSFAPRTSSIPHVMSWQQSLGRLILDGEYNPTTFNLAFLMHTLLRDQLERGAADLHREKSFLLPQPSEDELTGEVTKEVSATLPPVLADVEMPDEEPITSARSTDAQPEVTFAVEDSSPALAARDDSVVSSSLDRRPFWLGFGISAATASALLGSFIVFGSSTGETPASTLSAPTNTATQPQHAENPPTTTPPQASDGAATTPAPVQSASVMLSEVVNGGLGQPPAKTDEQDPEAISRAIADRTAEIERNLKAEYESQLESLRTQIKDSRQRELAIVDETAPIEETPKPNLGPERTGSADTLPFETGPAPTATSTPGVDSESAPTQPPRIEPEEALPIQALEPETQASIPAESAPAEVALDNEPTVPEATAVQPAPLEGTPPETESSPDPTELVETPARLIQLTPPTYPLSARRLGLSATARVKVLISTKGKVKEAEIIGPALGRGFDGAALTAVRRSRWQPATENGEPVESWNAVTIEFQP